MVDTGISPEAIDLLERVIEPDPIRRLSPSEALKHPWISGEGHMEYHRQRLGSVTEALMGTLGMGMSNKRSSSGIGVFQYMFSASHASQAYK